MLNLMMGTHAVVYPSTGFYDINIYLSQAKQIKDAVQILYGWFRCTNCIIS